MSAEPTTGDPVLDELIRDKLPEACDLVYAVLKDRHPELDDERVKKTSAIIVSQLLSPMMQIFIGGFRLVSSEFVDEGENGSEDLSGK